MAGSRFKQAEQIDVLEARMGEALTRLECTEQRINSLDLTVRDLKNGCHELVRLIRKWRGMDETPAVAALATPGEEGDAE